MKTVFSNIDECIHNFVLLRQSEGRSGNVYFSNKTRIYSYGYHYILGEFLNLNTIVINDKGYSVSTSRHINSLIHASSHKNRFYLSQIEPAYVLNQIKWNVKKLANARKPEIYLSEINSLYNSINEFADFVDENKEGFYDNIKIINLDIRETVEYQEIYQLTKEANEKGKEAYKLIEQINKDRERKEKELKKKRDAKSRKKFRAYKIDYCGLNYDILRVSKDKQYIETSQRVKIHINEAKRIVNLIEAKQKLIGEKIDNLYTVTAFNGLFKAGCHTIKRSEINRTINKIKNL